MASTTSPVKHEWMAILPDCEDAMSRRMQVRPEHFKNLKPREDSGFYLLGGAMLEEPIKEGETPKFKGSVVIVNAASREEVIEDLKNDVYSKNNVWDWDKVQIFPFKSAIRKPL